MKGLILKDLYNILRNVKSLLFVLFFLGVIFILQSQSLNYGSIVAFSLISSTLTATTFSFDNISKWTRYALIMPITRKELVISKFLGLIIFCIFGTLIGLLFTIIGGLVLHKLNFASLEEWFSLIGVTVFSFTLSILSGSFIIPLIFKYGIEKVRVFTFISLIVPVSVLFSIYKIFTMIGSGEQIIDLIFYIFPFFGILFVFLMYKISLAIFQKQDL